MLVADVAEELLEQVLECDHASGAAVLVYHDGQRGAVAQEVEEQVAGGLGLGHGADGPQDVRERRRGVEQVVREHHADDAVDGLAVDRQPAEAGVHERLPHVAQRRALLHGLHLGAWHEGVLDAEGSQLEDVRQDLGFLLVEVERARLAAFADQDLEVAAEELLERVRGRAGKLDEEPARPASELDESPEQDVGRSERQCERQQHAPGRLAQQRLWDHLTHHQHDQRGDDGLCRQDEARRVGEPEPAHVDRVEGRLEGHAHQRRVDHERDVVAHEGRGEHRRRVGEEALDDAPGAAALTRVDLAAQPVRRHERDLGAREKRAQHEHQQDGGEDHRGQ